MNWYCICTEFWKLIPPIGDTMFIIFVIWQICHLPRFSEIIARHSKLAKNIFKWKKKQHNWLFNSFFESFIVVSFPWCFVLVIDHVSEHLLIIFPEQTTWYPFSKSFICIFIQNIHQMNVKYGQCFVEKSWLWNVCMFCLFWHVHSSIDFASICNSDCELNSNEGEGIKKSRHVLLFERNYSVVSIFSKLDRIESKEANTAEIQLIIRQQWVVGLLEIFIVLLVRTCCQVKYVDLEMVGSLVKRRKRQQRRPSYFDQ